MDVPLHPVRNAVYASPSLTTHKDPLTRLLAHFRFRRFVPGRTGGLHYALLSRFQLYTYQRIDEALTNDRTSPPQGWETANNSYCPNRYQLMEREEKAGERNEWAPYHQAYKVHVRIRDYRPRISTEFCTATQPTQNLKEEETKEDEVDEEAKVTGTKAIIRIRVGTTNGIKVGTIEEELAAPTRNPGNSEGKEKRDENSRLEMLEGAKSIGAGAATIASAGAAVGIGNVPSSSIHSVARNPSLAKQSFGYAILGFALTEAIASFAPMMAFLISSVFRSKKRSFILRKRRPWSNRACKTPSERESVSHALAMGRGEVRRAPSLSVRQRLYLESEITAGFKKRERSLLNAAVILYTRYHQTRPCLFRSQNSPLQWDQPGQKPRFLQLIQAIQSVGKSSH
ncbi:uncharacterized protein LOC143869272 [Tasmannia lanceolata]|uniref:uncharacterized protein LOC143869272 n=1 Tax=Tasmannia lanceolata TaxID=3420 RepID=UPI004063306A